MLLIPSFRLLATLLVLLLTLSPPLHAETASEEVFKKSLESLNARNFRNKAKAVDALSELEHPRTVTVMRAMLEGNLYYRKSDREVLIAEKGDEGYAISKATSGESLGLVQKTKIKRISVNNSLRRQLRGLIARVSLSDSNPKVRMLAARELLKSLDSELQPLIEERLAEETHSGTRDALGAALAILQLDSNEPATRLQALKDLDGALEPEVRNRLNKLIAQNDDGEYIEPDPAVVALAESTLFGIEQRVERYAFIEKIYFGASLGSVLVLAAIGLAITFGVMGVINMAHGELIMLGAYTTYVIQMALPNHIEWSLFIAIPAAFLVSGLFGVAIERGVIRFLYGRPLETLLATFGISLILQQLVRSIFTALNRSVETPGWMSGSLEINSALSLTYNRLYIIFFTLMVFAALLLVLKKTSVGLYVRAVSQNRNMASAMGIRTSWVDALTFGLGSGIAGVAGVALSQLTNVGPNLGQAYIIDSFIVVVFGGVGNLWGTLVGGISLGVANKFLEPVAGAMLAKIMILVFIILFIQRYPRGLFPQKGRAADN